MPLIELTGFNPLDPRSDDQIVELESSAITDMASDKTGDGHSYTSITCGTHTFTVKETVSQVNDMIAQAK